MVNPASTFNAQKFWKPNQTYKLLNTYRAGLPLIIKLSKPILNTFSYKYGSESNNVSLLPALNQKLFRKQTCCLRHFRVAKIAIVCLQTLQNTHCISKISLTIDILVVVVTLDHFVCCWLLSVFLKFDFCPDLIAKDGFFKAMMVY